MVPEVRAQSRNGAFGKVSHLINDKNRFGSNNILFHYIHTYRRETFLCTYSCRFIENSVSKYIHYTSTCVWND